MEQESSNKKIYRIKKDSKIAGVWSGLGDYFKIDSTIVRIIFLTTFFLGAGPIIYIICWICIPMREN